MPSSLLPTSSYAHLTTHYIPGPASLSYFLPILLLPISLLIPHSTLSRSQNAALFLPLSVACTVHAWCCMRGVDVIGVDVLLWTVVLVGLRDVQGGVGYVRWRDGEGGRGGGGGGEEVGGEVVKKRAAKEDVEIQWYPERLSDRLAWVGTLLVSIRLNNWIIGEPSHDAGQPPQATKQTRWSFAKHSLLRLIRGYIILDLTSAYISHDPYFPTPTLPITSPLPFSHLHLILPPLLLRTTIIALQAWSTISQLQSLPLLIPLTLNSLTLIPSTWSPETWPPLFGNPTTAILHHGVRGFWSRYWHQAMRVITTAPGYWVADEVLGMERRGLGRYAVITCVAFGLSGVVHAGLVPVEPLYAVGGGVWALRVRVGGFFWVQPVGIFGGGGKGGGEVVSECVVAGGERTEGEDGGEWGVVRCLGGVLSAVVGRAGEASWVLESLAGAC